MRRVVKTFYGSTKKKRLNNLVSFKVNKATLPPLTEFILPGGTRAASQAHVCRTVCRRAERSIVRLGWEEPLYDAPRQYVNRLSDLLFVLARVLNRAAGGQDVLWKHEKKETK